MAYRVFPTPKTLDADDRPPQFGRRAEQQQVRRARKARRIRAAEIAAFILGSAVLAAFAAGAL